MTKRDALAELCELLRDCGATLTLYGKPVTEDALRKHADDLAIARIGRALGRKAG